MVLVLMVFKFTVSDVDDCYSIGLRVWRMSVLFLNAHTSLNCAIAREFVTSGFRIR